jgi:PPOX class probable F420-dependent enzyme
MDEITRLAESSYLLLTTFRKDGRAVPTPVWHVRDGDTLLVWSAPDAGKVKRIRRDGTVKLAVCNARGKPSGAEVDGTAELVDATEADRVRKLVTGRYGLIGKVTELGSRLRGHGSAGIRITVGPR